MSRIPQRVIPCYDCGHSLHVTIVAKSVMCTECTAMYSVEENFDLVKIRSLCNDSEYRRTLVGHGSISKDKTRRIVGITMNYSNLVGEFKKRKLKVTRYVLERMMLDGRLAKPVEVAPNVFDIRKEWILVAVDVIKEYNKKMRRISNARRK